MKSLGGIKITAIVVVALIAAAACDGPEDDPVGQLAAPTATMAPTAAAAPVATTAPIATMAPTAAAAPVATVAPTATATPAATVRELFVDAAEMNVGGMGVLPNARVAINGAGFTAGSGIRAENITIDGVPMHVHDECLNGDGAVPIGSDGGFVCDIALWPAKHSDANPALIHGRHTIRLVDNAGIEGEVLITIPEPTYKVTPEDAGPGRLVTITGENWPVDNPENLIDAIIVTVTDGDRERQYSVYANGAGRWLLEHRVYNRVPVPSHSRVEVRHGDLARLFQYNIPSKAAILTATAVPPPAAGASSDATVYATALPSIGGQGVPQGWGPVVPQGFPSGGPEIPPESGGSENPNDGAYPLTYYENYGVNPFIDADEDALSTFALDGDTASYEILKQYLRDGYLVDPDAVRVEEYLNSLPQGYPAAETVLGLHLDAGPSPFGDEGYKLLRVGVSNPAPTEDRKPVSLVFVVDVSGSMEADNRLELAKEVIYGIAEQMLPADRAAIVTYADVVRVAREFTDGDNARDIVSAARELYPGGSTYAEAGLRRGYALAAREIERGRKARLVLLSDGVANVGETGPDSILKVVDEHAQRNGTLTTIGVGITGNYNDVLMEVLANRGNGTYHYLSSREAAERFLAESAAGIFTETARDARIQVEFNPEVVRKYRLIGYENRAVADEDFRDDTLDFGEVGFARDVSALYELRLMDGASADATMATARLRWLDPQTGEATELEVAISGGDVAAELSDTNPYLRQAAAVAEFAELLRKSFWAQCGDLGAVSSLLDTVERELNGNISYRELRGLVKEADEYFEPYCKR